MHQSVIPRSLSGNSTDGTDYTFTIQVTDAANATATLDVTWPFGG